MQPRTPEPFQGPFLGLNTTQSSRQLGQAQAVVARNVTFAERSVQVRPPFRERLSGLGAQVVSLLEWENPAGQVITFRHVRLPSGPLGGARSELWADAVHCFTVQGEHRGASFMQMNGRMYVSMGRLLRTDGTPSGTFFAGLDRPTDLAFFTDGSAAPDKAVAYSIVPLNVGTDPHQAGLPAGHRIQVGFTFYNAELDIESNYWAVPDSTGPNGELVHTIGPAQTNHVWVLRVILQPGRFPPNFESTHVRVYVKDLDSDNRYILLGTISGTGDDLPQFDSAGNRVIEGTAETGPFAPTKNGVPDDVTVMVEYKGRMFFGRKDPLNRNRLFYSAIGRPDHCSASDFERQDDAGGEINGLGVFGDQLATLKEESIWILSGVIVTTTNATIATGAEPLPSSHVHYRTLSTLGCHNTQGPNGAIICGTPERLRFYNRAGFAEFDGASSRILTEWIDPTWRAFLGGNPATAQQVSHAIDSAQSIVYLCSCPTAAGNFNPARPQILAYHYGVLRPDGLGSWSVFDEPVDGGAEITAIATTRGIDVGGGERRYAGMLAARLNGAVAALDDEANDLAVPDFRFETGELVPFEGLTAHFFDIKWLHDRLPSGGFGQLRLGFAIVGSPGTGNNEQRVEQDANLESRISTYQRVWNAGESIRLIVSRNPDSSTPWHRNLRITGWGINAEPTGQR